jgi:DNA-binding transcriptional LysR family regulator
MGPVPPRLAPNFVRAGIQGRIDPSTGDFVPTIAVDSVALMKSIVSHSDAFGAAPAVVLATELAEGRLVALPISAPWAVAEPGIIRLRERPLTPAQETFLAELRAIDRATPATTRRQGSRRPAPPDRGRRLRAAR